MTFSVTKLAGRIFCRIFYRLHWRSVIDGLPRIAWRHAEFMDEIINQLGRRAAVIVLQYRAHCPQLFNIHRGILHKTWVLAEVMSWFSPCLRAMVLCGCRNKLFSVLEQL
jgi:hypothetical protein